MTATALVWHLLHEATQERSTFQFLKVDWSFSSADVGENAVGAQERKTSKWREHALLFISPLFFFFHFSRCVSVTSVCGGNFAGGIIRGLSFFFFFPLFFMCHCNCSGKNSWKYVSCGLWNLHLGVTHEIVFQRKESITTQMPISARVCLRLCIFFFHFPFLP